MAAVPFAKINALVQEDRKDRDVREILYKLAKALTGKSAYRVMQDYDQRMSHLSREEAGAALMSCIPDNPLDAELYVDIAEPISIVQLMKGVTAKSKVRRILAHLAQADSMGREGVVVFKVRHLGAWVAYNTADPYNISTPRVVLPSTMRGQASITIMPLDNYGAMWAARRGENDGWK
jgi:hypothetical protein